MELIYQYRDVIMFLYREAGNYDRESVHNVLAQETKYIEVFEDLLRQRFPGRKVNETRLELAADILSYLNVILVLRGWSLRRRYKSMDVVVDGILEFVEHAIEIVEDNDGDRVECPHFRKPAKSLSERRAKWVNRAKKKRSVSTGRCCASAGLKKSSWRSSPPGRSRAFSTSASGRTRLPSGSAPT